MFRKLTTQAFLLIVGFISLYIFHVVTTPITPISLISDQTAWQRNLINLNNKDLSYIEYFPGGIFFFVVPQKLSETLSGTTFVSAVLGINFSLLILYLSLVNRQIKTSSNKIVALLISYGVLILFRFDLIVALLLLASVFTFKKKLLTPATFLGLAIATKIFPVIFLPYLLIKAIQGNKRKVLFTLIVGISILMTFLLESVFYKIPILDLLSAALGYQTDKPIDIQSYIGTIIYIMHKTLNQPIEIFVTGIWGFYANQSLFKSIPNLLFDYLWIAPVGIVSLLLKKTSSQKDIIRAFILITTSFLLFSKMLPPQYFYWWVLILPFAQIKSKKIYFLTIVLGIVNQLVYPATFHSLIFAVQDNRIDHSVIILITRQILFLYLYATLISYYFKNNWLHFSWTHSLLKNNSHNN